MAENDDWGRQGLGVIEGGFGVGIWRIIGRTTFDDDDVHVSVHPAEAGSGGSASSDAANDDGCFCRRRRHYFFQREKVAKQLKKLTAEE